MTNNKFLEVMMLLKCCYQKKHYPHAYERIIMLAIQNTSWRYTKEHPNTFLVGGFNPSEKY